MRFLCFKCVYFPTVSRIFRNSIERSTNILSGHTAAQLINGKMTGTGVAL